MKVNFSRETVFIPEFNDNKLLPDEEQLKIKLKVMNLLDLLDLTDILKGVGFDKGDIKDLTVEQMKTIVKEGAKYIPKYASLVGADGFTLQDITDYAAFLPLATELLFTLLNNASPNAADAKNS